MKIWTLLVTFVFVAATITIGCDEPDDEVVEEEEPAEDQQELEEADDDSREGEEEQVAAEEPIIGEIAPDFTLLDEEGEEHTLSDYEGQTVVLEWFNIPCPYVRRHYEAQTFDNILDDFGGTDEIAWLAIDTTWDNTPEDTLEWKAETEELRTHDYPVLQDPDGEVGRLYDAKTTPHMFVIDDEQILRYMGGIDDDPRGREDEPTNYVRAALTAITEGESVSVSEAEPYGCTVKYDEDS